MNTEQLYSIPSYQAKFTRKEVDIELLRVGWMADRYVSRSQRLLPSFDRRLSHRSMHTFVIDFNDLEVEPSLQLSHLKTSHLRGFVLAPVPNRGESRARQQMEVTHHGANEPFDVAPKWGV